MIQLFCSTCGEELEFDNVGAHCTSHGLIVTWEELNENADWEESAGK